MIFDTDISIWVQRGNSKAAELVDGCEERYLSIYSYMELLQAARNKQQHRHTMDFLSALVFVVLGLSEAINHCALIHLEEYSLSHVNTPRSSPPLPITRASLHFSLLTLWGAWFD